MKHGFHIFAIVLAALFSACTSQTDVNQVVDDAEHLAQAGKFDDAIVVCDRLTTTADSSLLTATQYCRLALIYAIAADNDIDNDANMAKAMRSFNSASTISRDSVTAFVDGLTLERQSAVRTVLQLIRYQSEDPTSLDDVDAASQYVSDEQLDSIYNNEQ